MNEMRKLMEVIDAANLSNTISVDRFVIRHASGAYISNFSFGDNSQITNAKLFLTLHEAGIHSAKLSDGWEIIPVEVTIKEKL